MKKLTLIFAAFAVAILSANTAKPQANSAFETGTITISAGYGAGNLGRAVFKAFKDELAYSTIGFGPLHFKGEYGVSDNIGLGLSVNYVSMGASWEFNTIDTLNNSVTSNYKLKRSAINFLPRLNVHFGVSEKFDAFWGIGMGFNTATWTIDFDDDSFIFSIPGGFPVGFETTFGMRYYFVDFIGLYMEIGYAKAPLQGGLVFKF